MEISGISYVLIFERIVGDSTVGIFVTPTIFVVFAVVGVLVSVVLGVIGVVVGVVFAVCGNVGDSVVALESVAVTVMALTMDLLKSMSSIKSSGTTKAGSFSLVPFYGKKRGE